MSAWFLLFLVTAGNLAVGFGLGIHFGFGPDISRLTQKLRELAENRRSKSSAKPAADDSSH